LQDTLSNIARILSIREFFVSCETYFQEYSSPETSSTTKPSSHVFRKHKEPNFS
jgi:hypothetical protein